MELLIIYTQVLKYRLQEWRNNNKVSFSSCVCLSVHTKQPRLEKGGHIRTDPLSSGSAEAMVGVACVSVQYLEIAVVVEGLVFLTVIAAVVRVTLLVYLHLLVSTGNADSVTFT